mgnify:CR=1 FL=1
MKNIRLFFYEIIKVIKDEKSYHLSTEHPYKCVGNIWYPVVEELVDRDSTSYRTISKDEADQKGITGEVYTHEILLHEHNNRYIEISALHSDLYFLITEVQRIFQLFSINLRTLAVDNGIEIEYLTDEVFSVFHTRLNNTQRSLLFELLVDGGFIPKDTDKDDFIWVFGGMNGNNLKSKMTWLKNKGNPIALAKNKPVPSSDSDMIAEIHKKIATC